MTTSNDPVFGNHDSRDGAKENRVCGKIRSETVRVFEEVPWAHGEAHNGGYVSTTTNVLRHVSV